MAFNRAFFRKHLPTEVIPIVAIVGIAVTGATAYLFRLSQGAEVVWDRKGDWRPWDKVKQDQNLKLLTVNKDFWEKRKLAVKQAAERVVDSI